MKSALWLCVCILLTILTGCKETKQTQPTTERHRDDFEKKLKCAGLLEKLQEGAEHDQYEQEVYHRTFYSPRLNACLAEKYTLYKDDKTSPELLEIDDLSSNKTVWYSTIPCEVRDVGMADPPRKEYPHHDRTS